MIMTNKREFLLPILKFLYSFCTISLCFGSDTISLGQPLSLDQTIVSKGGSFELGSFSPSTSSNSYIGIWYRNTKTVVWVANRENPIPDARFNSVLAISNGSLVLYDNLKSIIWMAIPTIGNSNATEAILLDTGNLVLKDGIAVTWQSFDYPTDTWLPGGKIEYDKNTNKSHVLTSWRNSEDLSLGFYSLGMDPSGSPELFIWRNGSERIWRSGVWNGHCFPFQNNFNNSISPNIKYVSNEDTNYFTYNVPNTSITTRLLIDSTGSLKQLVWSVRHGAWVVYWTQPAQMCEVYAVCGSFGICSVSTNPVCSCLPGFEPRFPRDWNRLDWSNGCLRRNPSACNNDKVVFQKMANIRLPANSESLAVGRADICEYACSSNCSCSAYAYSSNGRCLFWSGSLLDLEQISDSGGGDLYLRFNSFEVPHKGSKKWIHASLISLTAIPFIICCSILCCLCRRKLNRKALGEMGTNQNLLFFNLDMSSSTSGTNNKMRGDKDFELPMFSFSSISAATERFSDANKLGEGGFGPVYKGNLVNGQSVAVKRLSRRSAQGLEELQNETVLIAKLQHRNLVMLLGCCIEQDEKILIYEYMPNKSLDFFLFDPIKQGILDWGKRIKIIEGISQGLLYLHQYSRLRIVHRDLKASNILLDGDMNPKISDFGMARIFGGNELQANTNHIVGTYGYMSPEYALEGRFSVKSDVFSFGVLLLEIVSGKRNTGFYNSDSLSLLGHAWELWKNDRGFELIDPTLQIPDSPSTLLKYIHVGLLCVQESPADRPTISDVITMFSNENASLVPPKPPAFIGGRIVMDLNSSNNDAKICSINRLTLTTMGPR